MIREFRSSSQKFSANWQDGSVLSSSVLGLPEICQWYWPWGELQGNSSSGTEGCTHFLAPDLGFDLSSHIAAWLSEDSTLHGRALCSSVGRRWRAATADSAVWVKSTISAWLSDACWLLFPSWSCPYFHARDQISCGFFVSLLVTTTGSVLNLFPEILSLVLCLQYTLGINCHLNCHQMTLYSSIAL